MIRITEAHDLRDALFEQLTAPSPHSDYAAQHDVWPCVLKGAADRWLTNRGETFPVSKSAALYFLRGKSAEAIITGDNAPQAMIVRNGVSSHPDLSRPALDKLFGPLMQRYPDIEFAEIKSTNFSSYNWYELVRAGGVDLAMATAFKMRNYVEQCGNYAVATGTSRCLLVVYFLHGDYADRRSTCPVCKLKTLGKWANDFYRECSRCGYRSKKMDLWIYVLDFDAETLARIDADVYGRRPAQFYAAIEAADEAGVRALAPPTPSFYCRSCLPGERIGCPNAGIEFD